MELTAALRKHIISLSKSKGRHETGLFTAEGTKCVLDTLPYFACVMLLATTEWLNDHGPQLPQGIEIITVTKRDIERMSALSTPQPVIAVYRIPADTAVPPASGQLMLALDRVQDPGNLGTIVRLCDWFGVQHILASHDTVDVFSPKVVQATMGAISRVKVHYCDLVAELAVRAAEVPVYGTFLDGESLYKSKINRSEGIIVMGNEGRGISPRIEATVNARLLIPSYPPERPTSESLNVAMATAIMLAEFRRPKML